MLEGSPPPVGPARSPTYFPSGPYPGTASPGSGTPRIRRTLSEMATPSNRLFERPPPEQWAGLYRVEPRWAGDEGVSVWMTPGVGFGDVYYGSSSGVGSSFVEPLGGGWYTEP